MKMFCVNSFVVEYILALPRREYCQGKLWGLTSKLKMMLFRGFFEKSPMGLAYAYAPFPILLQILVHNNGVKTHKNHSIRPARVRTENCFAAHENIE